VVPFRLRILWRGGNSYDEPGPSTDVMPPPYDVIIIGSGPAGLTAAIYATRANLKTLVIAGAVPGGQLMITTDVENYPGFPNGIQGPELMEVLRKQAERFKADFVDDNVTKVDFSRRPLIVWTSGDMHQGRSVIIATGANAKYLELPNEERLKGRGVSACATCLPTDSSIVANASPMPIQDIEKGQRVLTDDGSFQPVVARGRRRYRGGLVRIVPRYFREEATLLTPEHPVLATTLEKGNGAKYWNWTWHEAEWVPAGELNRNHILLYPIVSETKDVATLRISEFLGLPRDDEGRVHLKEERVNSKRLRDDVPLNADFMRLAGYFLADGCITSRGINFYFGPKDEPYVTDVVRIIERLFGYRANVKCEGSVRRVECYAGILRELFQRLFGKYSYGKSVPHWFLLLPVQKQAQLVRGFWRGDGGIKKQGFSLVSNSSKFVAQLKMILLRLGVIPGISRRSAKVLNKTENILNGRKIRFRHDRFEIEIGGSWLSRACEILGVNHPLISRRTRSNQHGWIQNGYAYLRISKIGRSPYSGTVHNLAVQGRNTYVTAGAIVHNCDGFFFKSLDVIVVGGGDTAMEEALYLSKLCKTVTVVHRRDTFRASKIMQGRLFKAPNVKVIWNSEVVDVLGQVKVEGVRIKNVKTGEASELKAQGLFLAIGHTPATEVFQGHLALDKGYISLRPRDGLSTATSVDGVFAAGDVHDFRYRQAVTAAGFGSMAALDAERWLQSHA